MTGARPKDSDDVIRAARLGWLIIEVRGRYEGDLGPGERRADFVLPLQSERSPKERAIETEKVLLGIAAACGLDQPVALYGNPPVGGWQIASVALKDHGMAVLGGTGDSRADAL